MASAEPSLAQRLVAEGVGTMLLLAAVVGSGVMGERLAGGNVGVTLLANSLATGAALVALIVALAPISGAQLNPVVTLAGAWERELPWADVPGYLAAQGVGALLGVALAHLMFDLPVFSLSRHPRMGPSQWLSEGVATFGLLTVVRGTARGRLQATMPVAVGAYIAAAYWFTASTSFANPAVTLARAVSDTFAGIRPVDVPGFVAAQVCGAAVATALFRWLRPTVMACVDDGATAGER